MGKKPFSNRAKHIGVIKVLVILVFVVLLGLIFFKGGYFTNSKKKAAKVEESTVYSGRNQTKETDDGGEASTLSDEGDEASPEKKTQETTEKKEHESSSSSWGWSAEKSIVVSDATVKPRDLPEEMTAIGTVVPSAMVQVRSQVSGQVTKLNFKEGQLVKKGDTLLEIDPRAFEAAAQRIKGQLAENQANLNNAQQDLKRYQTLFKQDSIARQKVDTQRALVASYNATQKSLEAQLQQAELDLEYSQVKAPLSGRVGLRSIDAGNLVSSSDANPLVTITQIETVDVLFSLPEQAVSKIASRFYQGQTFEASLYGRNDVKKLKTGVLKSIDNVIDPDTGSFKLKAQFDNKDYHLFPNQFVNVRLLVNEHKQVLSLLSDAIQRGKRGAYVFVIKDDNTVTIKTIGTGVVSGKFTEVISGLKDGDRVVLEGIDKLKEGTKVEIVK